MRRPVSWCQMRVRSWIESIGVSDWTPSSVSIQRRLRLSMMWTSWPRAHRCSAVGHPTKPSPPSTAIFMAWRSFLARSRSAIAVICDELVDSTRPLGSAAKAAPACDLGDLPRTWLRAGGATRRRDEAGRDDELGRLLDRHVEKHDVPPGHEEEEARGRVGRGGEEDADEVRLARLARDLAAGVGGNEGDGPEALARIFDEACLLERGARLAEDRLGDLLQPVVDRRGRPACARPCARRTGVSRGRRGPWSARRRSVVNIRKTMRPRPKMLRPKTFSGL